LNKKLEKNANDLTFAINYADSAKNSGLVFNFFSYEIQLVKALKMYIIIT